MFHTVLTSMGLRVTSHWKGQYKKLNLQQIIKGIRPDSEALIIESINKVEKEKV